MIMGHPGTWFFRYKGSVLPTVYTGSVSGFDDDAPGIIIEANSSCADGNAYHIVATTRDNARYAENLQFSTCGSGSLSILEATFTPDEVVLYDCLNGTCVPNAQHNTEGIYGTLAECEANCGSVSGCNGECVSKGKLSQLKNLANRLKRKNCGC